MLSIRDILGFRNYSKVYLFIVVDITVFFSASKKLYPIRDILYINSSYNSKWHWISCPRSLVLLFESRILDSRSYCNWDSGVYCGKWICHTQGSGHYISWRSCEFGYCWPRIIEKNYGLELALPTEPIKEPKFVLIYGGSTATATLGIQFVMLYVQVCMKLYIYNEAYRIYV